MALLALLQQKVQLNAECSQITSRADVEEEIVCRKLSSKIKELQKNRMKFNEEAAQNCYNVLKQWQPIFSSSEPIVSLSSGVNASEEVKNDLSNAESVGKTKSEGFIDNRIKKNRVGFYDVI